MRILVVGVGAVGGYFGGRLLQASRDVTFLVRRPRAEALRKSGLTIVSRFGDFHLQSPPLIVEDNLDAHFDLVLLSCKAYDLESAMNLSRRRSVLIRRFCLSSMACAISTRWLRALAPSESSGACA